jgi:hypothetical protein
MPEWFALVRTVADVANDALGIAVAIYVLTHRTPPE